MIRWTRDAAFTVLAAFLAAGAVVPAAGQSAPPPDADWRTLRTAHFRVTYTPDLEPLARQVAGVAERVHAILRDELMEPPDGTIDLVVTDHVDYANGYAMPFPSPRTVVYARPPVESPSLGFNRSWLETVVAHEIVHIFHLEETGGVGRAVRAVFGNVPTLWPVYPVIGSPTWSVEGLATHYETRITGTGRVAGSYHDMVVRTAALEARIPDLDELSLPHPGWPGGDRSYAYGGRFMRYISDRYGPDAHGEIVEATGEALLPTFLFFDRVAERAVGEPFDDLYDAWRRKTEAEVHARARQLRAQGLTPTEWVGGTGPRSAAPRVSPDGSTLSFAAHDYRSFPGTRLVELGTGRTRTLARRNQFGAGLGPASWLPDGRGLVFAQLERHGRFRSFSDLWHLDLEGKEERLTHGARLAQPDVASDGRRVAAVQSHRGGIRLVVHDLETGRTRVVVEAAPGDAFDGPRWSPGGRTIAAARYTGGQVDLVTVDAASGEVTRRTRDAALDLDPAWSPDGQWLLWWSDRTGIPQVMAASVDSPRAEPRRVTRVLTGAFDPEVSPDGRTLYLAVYHHDGWRIERMPFDPETWTPAGVSVLEPEPALLPAPEAPEVSDAPETPETSELGGSRPYSPWSTIRPYHWLPTWDRTGGGTQSHTFIGAQSSGEDLVARHVWSAALLADPGTGRVQGRALWSYRGWGSPELRLAGRRDWTALGAVDVDGDREVIYDRSDELSLDATFWSAGYRRTAWLRVGADAEARELVPYERSRQELADAGVELSTPATVAGISASPGFSSARFHPYSVSPEDGVSGSVGVGRWWTMDDGAHAYDEVVGRISGYVSLPLRGFANHVLAVRGAGMVREGDRAFPRSIGGVPGGINSLPVYARTLIGGAFSTSFLPVRGFEEGVRRGNRAWAVNLEYRAPLHLAAAPGEILGFSLTSIAGTAFGDIGNAWCTGDVADRFSFVCDDPGTRPLISVGGELAVAFGALHIVPATLRAGVAQPLQGRPEPLDLSFYLAWGVAF